MAATTAPTAKAVAYSRSQSVKRTKMPSAMPVAAPAPPHSSNPRGKRPRASDGHMDLERPRRVKSSRGQKRADATGAAVSDVKPAADSKAANGSVAQNEGGGGGAYRRVMFASFIKQAFDKRAKGDNEEYNQIIVQFRALLPSASASAAASTSSGQPTATPLSQLRSWLEALTSVVSKLDQSHAPLVETILSIPWAITEESFTIAYSRFVGALVSARTEWLKVVLEKCVKGFKYRSTYTQSSPHALPHLTRRLVYSRLHSLLRLLLSLVPTLSPSLSPLLALHFPSKRESRAAQICYIDNLLNLTEYCSALSEDVLTLVVERALNIDVEIQGEPEDWEEVEEEMLAAEAEKTADGKARAPETAVHDLVDRPMEDESDDSDSDDDEDDEDEGGLDLDNLSSDDDEPDPINDEDAEKKAAAGNRGMSEAAIRKVLDNRAKLDGILKVVLDHLAVAHADTRHLDQNKTNGIRTAVPVAANPFDSAFADSPADEEETGSRETTPTAADAPSIDAVERRMTLFRTFLDIFDRTLLRTFKTRNVQFVLFYLCSLDPSSSDHFIGVLLGRALFDTDAPSVTRVAAAGYVASFVARAKYVDAGMTRKVVRHLCGYLEGQMEDFARANTLATSISGTRTGAATGGQELPVFYAVSQAVFYIFCFRWKDLLEDEDADDETALFGLDAGRRWLMGLETVKKAVNSSFNPLKVCAQPVVTQFASIAHKTNFMYCYAILDANRRATTYRDTNPPAVAAASAVPPPPLRSVSTSSLLNTLTAQQLHLSTPSPAGTPAPPSVPAAAPRQLLVAEEMDSFFPFDPFKLPLSSVYIDPIYREWEGAEDDESTTSGDHSSSSFDSDEDDTGSESDAIAGEGEDDEPAWVKTRGGLAVPGSVTSPASPEDDEFSRSFEAMSLSLSPQHESFGGRHRKSR